MSDHWWEGITGVLIAVVGSVWTLKPGYKDLATMRDDIDTDHKLIRAEADAHVTNVVCTRLDGLSSKIDTALTDLRNDLSEMREDIRYSLAPHSNGVSPKRRTAKRK